MAGTLEHREVFDTMGHGALLFDRARDDRSVCGGGRPAPIADA